MLAIFGLLLVFYLLAKICDEYFVSALDIIAKKLRISEDIAGATFMAIGSSAPELFTSLFALTKVGSENVGAGTIVGSAIFNILIIVGASAAVASAYLSWKPVLRDLLFYSFSIVVLFLTFVDGKITLIEAGIYLIFYLVYILVLARWKYLFPGSKVETQLEEIAEQYEKSEEKLERKGILGKLLSFLDELVSWVFFKLKISNRNYLSLFALSILYIVGLSWVLVELGISLATSLGVPEVIIALTILAAGTSVPDLLSSLIVAKQGRGDMAVSNAVGSNTFDIFIGLGFPWFLYTMLKGEAVLVSTENLTSSILLLFFTVVSLLVLLIIQKFKIDRRMGLLLIGVYAGYLIYAISVAL